MAKRLDLPTIQALAASGDYGGTRTLSAETVTAILAAAVFFEGSYNWEGAGYALTTEEKDTICALTATLQYEVTTEVAGVVGNYVKIAESVYTEDVEAPIIEDFDEGEFQAYELWVSGMRSSDATLWVEDVVLKLNLDEHLPYYNSLSIYENATQYLRYEHIHVNTGIRMYWATATEDSGGRSVGFLKIKFHNPQTTNYKYLQWDGTASDQIAGRIIQTHGTGMFWSENPITSIRIEPFLGDTFLVDSEESTEPDELRMTLYGLT